MAEYTVTEGSAAKPAPMPPLRPRVGAAAATLVVLLALAALWWAAAPPALGGRTTIVSVDGTSMLPGYRRSDLVALRPAATYRIGEVVGYRSTMLHRIVLHRIVAIHDGHYALRGDNNTFTDPEQPTLDQIVGSQVAHIPKAGRAIGYLHRPWLLALLAAAGVLAFAADTTPKRIDAAE